ncbi:MAG: hypothetical protein ACTSRS_04840 [Candidatus Helarchaeota archaeon]
MQDLQTISLIFGILGTIIGGLGTLIGIFMNWRYQKLQEKNRDVELRLKNIEYQKTMSFGIDPELSYESI